MTDKKIRFAVVGCCNMANRHSDGIAAIPGAELVCVCDNVEEKAKKRAEERGVPYYLDYNEMLRVGGFDAVIICTPDQIHREQVVAALEMGYHVLCEKPLALTMDDCRAIVEASHKAKGKFMVGQVCRMTPGFVKAKELIDAGEIGDVFFIESEYAHDYSHITTPWRLDPVNLRHGITGGGCHAVDLIRWIAGDPSEVMAYSNHMVLKDWPVDDCTIAIMKFPSGAVGKVYCSIGCKRNYTMRTVIYGTKGTIICDNRTPEIQLYQPKVNEEGKPYWEPDLYPVDLKDHNAEEEVAEFYNAIVNDLPSPVPAEEGANTIAVCDACVRSSASGKPEIPDYVK